MKKEYSATNMTAGLMYKELKLTSKLIKDGLNIKEIRQKAYEENIYQARSENFNKTITSILMNRIQTLDSNIINLLSNSSLELEKQIAIYSVMKSDRLFFEFVRELYCEKIINKDYEISQKDISNFMDRKKEQSLKVNSWKITTIKKLQSVYISMLVDANFIKRNKQSLEIIIPIIDHELENHLKSVNETNYLNAMSGEI